MNIQQAQNDDYVDWECELYHWTLGEISDGEEHLKISPLSHNLTGSLSSYFGEVSRTFRPVSGGRDRQGHPPLGAKLSRH